MSFVSNFIVSVSVKKIEDTLSFGQDTAS